MKFWTQIRAAVLLGLLASGAAALVGCGKDAPQDRGRKLKAQMQKQKIREIVQGTWRSDCMPLFLESHLRGLFAQVEFRLDVDGALYEGEKRAYADADCKVPAFTLAFQGRFETLIDKYEIALRRDSLTLTAEDASIGQSFNGRALCGHRWLKDQPLEVGDCPEAGGRFDALYMRGTKIFEAQECPPGVERDDSDPRKATPENPPKCERYFMRPAR